MANETPIYNPSTQEIMSRIPTTLWRDGLPLTTARLGAIYNQDADGYYKYGFSGPYCVSRLSTINEENFKKLVDDLGDEPAIICMDATVLFTANYTIPGNISIIFMEGCYFNTSATTIVVNAAFTNNVSIEQFGGAGDGVYGVSGTDNTNAFLRFNAWAKTKGEILVTLNFKYGKVYRHRNPFLTINLLNVIINGNGSTLENYTTNVNDQASLFTAGVFSVKSGMGSGAANVASYLIETELAGSTQINLKTIADASHFVIGEYVAITSMSISFAGYPPSFKYFDYCIITDIDVVTGVLTLNCPLKYTYKDDALWTNMYDAYTGQASVHRIEMGSKFGINQMFNDLILDCSTRTPPTVSDYTIASGLKLIFNRCTFQNFNPTGAEYIETNYCTIKYGSELDKVVTTYVDNYSKWKGIGGGAGITNLIMNNSIINGDISDLTPRHLFFTNVTIIGNPKFGGRAGGIDTFVINGGKYTKKPYYTRGNTQTQTITLGSGTIYTGNILSVPVLNNIDFNFLSRCDVGRRIDVTQVSRGFVSATGNMGIITDFCCDGETAFITVDFNKPIAGNEQLTIFNEPFSASIINCNVENVGVVNQDYFMTIKDSFKIPNYNVRVDAYTNYDKNSIAYGVPKNIIVNVKKPYTGPSPYNGILSVKSLFPIEEILFSVDLKTVGLRSSSWYNYSGFTGTQGESAGEVLKVAFNKFVSIMAIDTRCTNGFTGTPDQLPIVDIEIEYFTEPVSNATTALPGYSTIYNKDLEITDAADGLVLVDATTLAKQRITISNGVIVITPL